MKYLLLEHYRGAPEALNAVPMDRWTPEEVEDHVQFMTDFAARLESTGEFLDAHRSEVSRRMREQRIEPSRAAARPGRHPTPKRYVQSREAEVAEITMGFISPPRTRPAVEWGPPDSRPVSMRAAR
jgi:hypothetical protein